ncbi:MAG: hypothetical protein BWY02_02864 [bacterium ADurb.Bin157]|nr:MAG: hypothetical protein BWY02_02864 [bacterium ADurb.Bin157]
MSVIDLREPENICPTEFPEDIHHDCKETIADLKRENAELRKLVEQMKEWLEGGCSGCCEKNTDECRNECRVNRLLEAAKGLEK